VRRQPQPSSPGSASSPPWLGLAEAAAHRVPAGAAVQGAGAPRAPEATGKQARAGQEARAALLPGRGSRVQMLVRAPAAAASGSSAQVPMPTSVSGGAGGVGGSSSQFGAFIGDVWWRWGWGWWRCPRFGRRSSDGNHGHRHGRRGRPRRTIVHFGSGRRTRSNHISVPSFTFCEQRETAHGRRGSRLIAVRKPSISSTGAAMRDQFRSRNTGSTIKTALLSRYL
jgi:hypothetical protein